ncbi:hypothetical protein J3A78_000022 [Streptomyces sp. PvR006]|nr:hypothetical protein [Streptomyces sp. PvR006]
MDGSGTSRDGGSAALIEMTSLRVATSRTETTFFASRSASRVPSRLNFTGPSNPGFQ